MAQSSAASCDFSPTRLQRLLESLAVHFPPTGEIPNKDDSRETDFSDPFAVFSEFVCEIPSLIAALEALKTSPSYILTRNTEALLTQLHHFSADLEKTRQAKESLFAALQDAEKRSQESASEEMRLRRMNNALIDELEGKDSELEALQTALEEALEKSTRESRANRAARLHLTKQNTELRRRLALTASRLSSLQVRKSTLKHAFSRALSSAKSFKSATDSLSTKLCEAEHEVVELSTKLQASEGKVRRLEEELSFQSSSLKSVSAEEEITAIGTTVREEIDASVRMSLGEDAAEVEEEAMFRREGSKLRRSRISVCSMESERLQPLYIFSATQLTIETRIGEIQCQPIRDTHAWTLISLLTLCAAVLYVRWGGVSATSERSLYHS